ncbi:hypothetical protein QCA50_003405 [Cerrena zonata]|uniref:F-box domain-containing protein n=1 Tax=Cerrena zonata TaxID=2478898 RepID=A0AAW0GKF7_9APHY
MTRIPPLAQELLDYILDFLHDDHRTLRICALVSKCFLDASRHHLFETTAAKGRPYADKFEQFRYFIQNGQSAKYIRRLVLNSGTSIIQRNLSFHLSLDVLEEIVVCLPFLRSVGLSHFQFVCPKDFSITSVAALGCDVSLSQCIFGEDIFTTLPGLLQILSATSLYISTIRLLYGTPMEALYQHLPTKHSMTTANARIYKVERGFGVSPEIMRILGLVMPENTIVDLKLRARSFNDAIEVTCLGVLIAKHASSLRSLQFIPGDWRGLRVSTGYIPWSLLNLSSLCNLNSLYLEINHNLPQVSHDAAWELYLAFIALLPQSMEHIDIKICMVSHGPITYPVPAPTGAIQQLRYNFPNLKTLKLYWHLSKEDGEAYAEEVVRQMKALLPEFDRQGILQCSYS